jgi:polyisoprenoid-binding protein YceI
VNLSSICLGNTLPRPPVLPIRQARHIPSTDRTRSCEPTTMRTFITASLALAAYGLLAASPACAQQVDAPRSEVGFTFKQMGVPVDGHFRKFDAQIAFDPKKPDAGKVLLAIETGSASIGPEVDGELIKPTWFNTAAFPRATFTSSSIKALGGGKFEVAGKLAIKGQTQNVTVPIALTQAAGATSAVGSLAIKRLDFKIGEGEWADTSMVANDVQVKFKLTLRGMAPL